MFGRKRNEAKPRLALPNDPDAIVDVTAIDVPLEDVEVLVTNSDSGAQTDTDDMPESTPAPKRSFFSRFGRKKAAADKDSTEGSPQVEGEDSTDEAADENEADDTPAPRKGLAKLFSRRKNDDGEAPANAPIRVLIGFMADVSEKDARAYALGVASNHCENQGLAFYGVFKHKAGYVYEIHEAGDGRAYLPSILKHFDSLGAFSPTHPGEACIRTGTRHVQVTQTREGLEALQLTEDATIVDSEWLRVGPRLSSVISSMRGVFIAGAVVFAAGMLFAVAANLGRIVPEQSVPKFPDEVIAADQTPLGQLQQLKGLQLADDDYVTALKLERGVWKIERHSERAQPQGAVAPGNAGPAPMTPSAEKSQ